MRLGITRDDQQLQALRQKASERGVEVIALPVTSVEYLDFEWPSDVTPETVDWVFFTSAHGVNSFFKQAENLGIGFGNGTRFGVIGNKTGLALKDLGKDVSFESTESYGQVLFEEFVESMARDGEKVIYARAEHVNYDPTNLFQESNIDCVSVVCYRTRPRQLDPRLAKQLTGDDYILFTAPSAIESYDTQFGKPAAKPIAIGRSTAAAMNERGWFGFITMKQADVDNVLEYL